MGRQVIRKPRAGWTVPPNLVDYEKMRSSFSWDAARRELDGLPSGGLNIAHEAVDRHAAGSRAHHLALRWIDGTGQPHDYTYARLQALTGRFANLLRGLGVGSGDRVFALTPRIPELYITALGNAEEHQRLLSPVLRLWARTHPGTHGHRWGQDPGHDRNALQAQGKATTRFASRTGACPHRRRTRRDNRSARILWTFHDRLAAADERFTIPPTDPERWRCSTSPAAPRANPKGRFTSMRRSSAPPDRAAGARPAPR